MTLFRTFLLGLALTITPLSPVAAGELGRPASVVELFTSQGCSSCPPADAFLSELADRGGVLALSIHVDYWDYIGWKDSFADPAFTARQESYRRSLGGRYIYTPQMVIAGTAEQVGSKREQVEAALAARAGHARQQDMAAALDGDLLRLSLPESEKGGTAWLWLMAVDSARRVEVGRGENAGRTLGYRNVVRSIERVGVWSGEALDLSLDLGKIRSAGRDRIAILLQRDGHGPIIGALTLDLTPGT